VEPPKAIDVLFGNPTHLPDDERRQQPAAHPATDSRGVDLELLGHVGEGEHYAAALT
jgi:hypothetical protein